MRRPAVAPSALFLLRRRPRVRRGGTAWLAAVLLAGACLAAGLARSQPTPTAEQMIEQLQPAPRSRSLGRNLVIEQAPPAGQPTGGDRGESRANAQPAGSLSLRIQFDFDSVEVQADSQQALANLAQALQSPQLARSRFVIEGHTDARGRRDYNLRLSQRRADAVRAVLAGHGVDAARLQTAGRGPDEPADTADPNAAANRRVRIVNLD